MMDAEKYRIGYYTPPVEPGHVYQWPQKDHIEKSPVWCSVDLRDGNQSLVVPMNLNEKLRLFSLLVEIGFKEIEIGFPAASETEFRFVRTLIEGGLIPEDVTIQVLTQCREDIIRRTFEAIDGAPKAIVHFYNSTSAVQRELVFEKSRDEIRRIAENGARLIKKLSGEYRGNFLFEYSPESFTGTEPDFAAEVCNAVLDILEPVPERPVIINLPDTVQMSMPHIYANQVEWCSDHLKYRRSVILSSHPHNDRGCGVACAELAVLAGAQRIECCLFGNGERAGNVDSVTLALNLYMHGVDPGLDLSDLPYICEVYRQCTHMEIPDRAPYAGDLVFAAFSGSHQDAIAKFMAHYGNEKKGIWNCPYIPVDPEDLNRTCDLDVIRINSQSGKGGIHFVLEQHYGYNLPSKMSADFGSRVKALSDRFHKELTAEEVYRLFAGAYLNKKDPVSVPEIHFKQNKGQELNILAAVTIERDGSSFSSEAPGNGRLDAAASAIRQGLGLDFQLTHYSVHSLSESTKSCACSYISLLWDDGETTWGAGTDNDIILSGVRALISAINLRQQEKAGRRLP